MTRPYKWAGLSAATALAAMLLAGVPAWCSQTWSMEADFSQTTNPNGPWSYGYLAANEGSFVLYNTKNTGSFYVSWNMDGNGDTYGTCWKNLLGDRDYNSVFLKAGGVAFHPGPNDEKPTARWTAPYAATVYVSASFWGMVYTGGGTTTDASVLHNGVKLFAGSINGYAAGGGHATFGTSPYQSYGALLQVETGDTIDFCVGYGDNNNYSSDTTGVSAIITDAPPGPPILVINEVQSANSSTIADEDGDHPDWIEVYNAGGQAANLLDYGLSDDPLLPFKWTFPSYWLGPGQFLVVFASDKDRKAGPYFHTNYAIKSSGENISLTAPDGTLVSQIPATSIPQEMSVGRQPDASDSLFYFSTPTPGAPNNTSGYTGILFNPPAFSRARGFYPSAFNLTLSTSEPDATIRYTTDGSVPTESSPAYTGPIAIPAGAAGAIFKTTPVRAALFKTGYRPSPVATNTYFVGPGSSTRYNLPVISLATNNSNFFDPSTGIYTNPTYEGDAWERPIHVEYFEPGGTPGFFCDAGVRIHGNFSVYFPQKSLRLYADHQGGPGSFNYPIFPDLPITDYKRIVLRNWGDDNEWFPDYYPYIPRIYALIRDCLSQSLVWDMDVDCQHYRPAVVFYNGEYWGLYGIYEREDKYWIKNHHPEVDEKNLDVIQQMDIVEVEEGDATALNALLDWFQTNDLMIPANYEYAKSRMDVTSTLIHNLLRIYIGDLDYPYNNVRFWRERTETGKFRWGIYDCDFTFGMFAAKDHDTLAYATTRDGYWVDPDRLCVVLASLLRNPESRNEFINLAADMLNTVLRPDNLIARIDAMQAELSPYIAEHFHRWGDKGNLTQWNANVQLLRDYANQRYPIFRNQMIDFFKLSGMSNLSLDASPSGAGAITVSTINLPSSSLPWQGTYFNDVPIKLTAVPSAGYRFVRWNGGGLGTQNPATIVLTGDTSITAVFEVNQ